LVSRWNSAHPTSSSSGSLPDINAEVPDDDDDACLPLAGNAATRKELLALLPPSRYCDALKDVYFRVFSPVGLQVLGSPKSKLTCYSYFISFRI
jgi:hypothetical protein